MSIYAIAVISGLQYKLTKGQQFEAGRVCPDKDRIFKTDKVLLVHDGKKVSVGVPYVKGASVVCEVLKEFRGKKIIAYKYRKRKSSKWKRGHRQQMCLLKVKEITVG